MVEKHYHFLPQYLPLSEEIAFGKRLHEFQVLIRDILKMEEDCLFLNAPTASGKTFAFILPTALNKLTIRRPKTLIISPTNLLIAQTREDIEELIRENTQIKDIMVSPINSHSLNSLSFPERATKIKNAFTNNDVIISNPDIISLFLSGFYYKTRHGENDHEFNRNRTTADIFSELDVVVFDEYHVYSEEEQGKIAALINLTILINKIPKMIFASATPNYKIREILISLGIKCRDFTVKTETTESGSSRRMRGEIELTVTDQCIKDSLTTHFSEDDKVLFLFDHKIDAEDSRDRLIKMGVNTHNIRDLSGFTNKAKNKQEPTGNEKYIIATNAAEQGLNLDVSISHIEPGLYIENLTQRYGRIGRQGKNGTITVHISKSQVDKLSQQPSDFSELVAELEGIFLKKESYISRIKRHLAAFLALCTIRDRRGIFAKDIQESVHKTNDKKVAGIYNSILDFNKMVESICQSKGPNPTDIVALRNWWEMFLLSIGFFRGQSKSVMVRLYREDGILETTEDLEWIKRWCETEIIGKGKDQIYVIKAFREIPSTVELEFNVPNDTVRVNLYELHDRQKFKKKYCNNISDFLSEAFEDFEDFGFSISDMQDCLQQVIEIIYPDMLMPKEVESASESQII